MDNVQIVLLCIGIAVVAAAAGGIPLFFAGGGHRKKGGGAGALGRGVPRARHRVFDSGGHLPRRARAALFSGKARTRPRGTRTGGGARIRGTVGRTERRPARRGFRGRAFAGRVFG